MAVRTKDLWGLVWGRPQVDPNDLAKAVESQAGEGSLDYRTRLLIRDSVEALNKYWGEGRLRSWLERSPAREQIEEIWEASFERPGFPSLKERLVEKTDPETIATFLRELSVQVSRPARLYVGGAASLILPGYLSRSTEDIDVVDEVPAEIRSLHRLLAQLQKSYGLEIAHFQSHYLPSGWQDRVHSLKPFGRLEVYLVDVYDMFLSKLFSARIKDREDLRALAPQLDKDTLVRRFKETTASLRSEVALRQKAEKNWYILYGEALPS